MPLRQLAQPPPPQLHSEAWGTWQSVHPASPQPSITPAPHPPVEHPPVEHPPVEHPPVGHPPVEAHPLNPKAATLMAAAIMKNRMSQILLNFLGQLE